MRKKKKIPQFKHLTRENLEGFRERLERGKLQPGDHEIVRELYEIRKFTESLVDEDDEYVKKVLREVYRWYEYQSEDKDTEHGIKGNEEECE